MDAETREVLAMASWPFFDPNIIPEKKDPKEGLGRNHVVSDAFEPGSTFKVFLMSAALDQNMVREQDRIYCEGGKCLLAGHSIKDVHPHGWLTMQEVIKYSSNIGAAKIALHIGSEKYSRYIHDFGFGSLSGIDLPGEFKGLVRPQKRWRPIDLAVTGFGQSIGVTSLQLTNAIAVIAGGGEYGPPIIASNVLDSEGRSIKAIPIDQNTKGNSEEDSRPGSCYDGAGNSGRRNRGQCGARGLYGGRQDWNGSGNGQNDEALRFEQVYLSFYRVCPG